MKEMGKWGGEGRGGEARPGWVDRFSQTPELLVHYIHTGTAGVTGTARSVQMERGRPEIM